MLPMSWWHRRRFLEVKDHRSTDDLKLSPQSTSIILTLTAVLLTWWAGTTPRTVADKEWWHATDKKFQAWPRTAGPPVVMNPISRQNFIVKDLKP